MKYDACILMYTIIYSVYVLRSIKACNEGL